MPLGVPSPQTSTGTTRGAAPSRPAWVSKATTALSNGALVASNPAYGKYLSPLPAGRSPLQPWQNIPTATSTAMTVAGNQQSSALQALLAQSAAQQQALQSAADFDTARAGQLRDLAIAGLQSDTGLARSLLASDRYRTVDLGLQGVDADRRYWNTISNAWDTETANIQSDQAKQREFLARAFGIETSALDAAFGFAGTDLGLANRAAQLSYDNSSRAALSDATTRGAMTSKGFRDTRGALLQQLGLSRETNQLNYDRTVSDIGTRRQNATLSKDRGEQGLVKAWADRMVDTERNKAQVTRGLSDADRTAAALQSLASDFGMRDAELVSRLQRGMQQANLDYADTIAAITSAMQSNTADRDQAVAIAQALITGGI